MKSALPFLLLVFSLSSCRDESGDPNVSSIQAEVDIQRFEKDFFAVDTLKLENALLELQQKYPEFLPLYMQHILGLDSENRISAVKNFLQLSRQLKKEVDREFEKISVLQKEFSKAFQHVKYYFPNYKIPKIITLIGPVDAMATTASGEVSPNFMGNNFIGISLQFYLGKEFPLYSDPFFVTQVAPHYRSRKFEKNYLVVDAMKLVVDDLYLDNSAGKNLMEQIIEKGKQAWLLQKFMPSTPDSVLMGYTQNQLDWCVENEGLIWSYIITNEKDIYTSDPVIIQTYIGEAPFTAVFPQESPGNIGAWIGRQIVTQYASKNGGRFVSEIMQAKPDEILQDAKYKPK